MSAGVTENHAVAQDDECPAVDEMQADPTGIAEVSCQFGKGAIA